MALSAILLLTGCASSPSTPAITIEDQAKLIEYDNCIQVFSSARDYPQLYWEFILQDCAKYRP
jgi:hypothetical protein